jgi:hypothetical protein
MRPAVFNAADGSWKFGGPFPDTWEPTTDGRQRTYALYARADDILGIRGANVAYFYIDNVGPTIVAPAGVTVEQSGPAGTPADQVNLGMPTVTDDADPNPLVTNDAPAVFPPGRTLVTWTATDWAGNAASATQVVYVADSRPPTINLTVKKTLHPANNKMVLAAKVSVADACDPAPHVVINVSSSDVVKAVKGGKDKPDWQIVQDGGVWSIWLRAETAGRRTTRVYTMVVQATDAAGNAARALDTVTVVP